LKPTQRKKRFRSSNTKFRYYSSNRGVKRQSQPSYRLGIGTLLILIMLALVANLYNDTNNVAVKVGQSGQSRSHLEYSDKATEILNKSLFSKTKLTINFEAVEQGIEESFPEVEQASLKTSVIGSKLSLDIILDEPVIIINNDSGQFLVDRQGKIIGTVNKSYDLPKVFDKTSVVAEPGEHIFRSDQIKLILEVIAMLDSRGKQIKNFELPAKTTNEIDAKLTEEDYVIKLSFSLDSKLQIGKYFALLPTIEQRSPKKYVDLRVGERAYIK